MRTVVKVSGSEYTVALDDARHTAQRWWSVIQARLVDELTGRPLRSPIQVECDREGLVPRSTQGGIAGVAGEPSRVFASPSLADNSYDIAVTFRATGYVPFSTQVTLGPIPGFPEQFAPFDLHDIPMHREPVVIRGRVVQGGVGPVAGITVQVDELWLQLPSATESPPADPLNVLSLQPPLQSSRNSASAWLHRRELVAVAGEDKELLLPVASGVDVIRCSDRLNLSVGDIIAIDSDDPERTEYISIAAIDGASTAEQAAHIKLDYPLLFAHRHEAVVHRVIPQPAGSDNSFGVDAIGGDSCVLLESVNDLDGVQFVEIEGGSQPNEFRRIFPFNTQTDADGYFRLPPLSRVAQLNLHVHDGSLSADIENFVPDYGGREHWLDITV